MFNSRLTRQVLASNIEHQKQAAADAARIAALERQLAIEQERFNWMTVHVNELKAERAILFERVLGMQIPAMEIARAPADVGPVAATPRLTPEMLRDQIRLAPPPEGEPGRVLRRPGGEVKDASALVAEALAAGDLFNDVGDAKAREMGLGWDDEGNLKTDLPPGVAGSR